MTGIKMKEICKGCKEKIKGRHLEALRGAYKWHNEKCINKWRERIRDEMKEIKEIMKIEKEEKE